MRHVVPRAILSPEGINSAEDPSCDKFYYKRDPSLYSLASLAHFVQDDTPPLVECHFIDFTDF